MQDGDQQSRVQVDSRSPLMSSLKENDPPDPLNLARRTSPTNDHMLQTEAQLFWKHVRRKSSATLIEYLKSSALIPDT